MSATLKVKETATRLILHGSKPLLDNLTKHFRFRPPDYWRAASYQLYARLVKSGQPPRGWDGYMSPVQAVRDRKTREVTCWELDRGHKEELLQWCSEEGVEVDGQLLRSPFADLEVDDIAPDLLPGASFELDHRQRECICNLLKAGYGVIRASVSSGKTAVFCGCAAAVKQAFPNARCLYVVPTERLVQQVMQESQKFLPDWSITQYGGGKKNLKGTDLIVATTASLHANYDELRLSGVFKSFMVLLWDECHRVGSVTAERVCRTIPAFFRFGGSDSVKDERERDIVKGTKIRGLFGPRRAEIEMHQLLEVGRVATPIIHLVDDPTWDKLFDDLPHVVEPNTPAWVSVDGQWQKGTYLGPVPKRDQDGKALVHKHTGEPIVELGWHEVKVGEAVLEVNSRHALLHRAYDQGIIRFKPRNNYIVAWCKHFAAQGWPTLVVATRTVHVHILESLLTKAGLQVRSLISDHTTKERDEAFKWLVDMPGILVSPLLREGVSIPELKAGVVADVVADSEIARQIIGRFIRKKPDGSQTASLVWFLDRQVKSARKGGLQLFKELEKLRGYTYKYPCLGPDSVGPMFTAVSLD